MLIDRILPRVEPAAGHVQPSGPTLVRREHASVILSSGPDAVLMDPIFRGHSLRCAVDVPLPEVPVQAAFVTHSHSDHFNLATLDHLVTEGVGLYVPTVPAASLLSEDMTRITGTAGITVTGVRTGDVVRIGDVTVEALPFYGEQPSAEEPLPEGQVRNWGNCYRVDLGGFSVLVLADAGTDPSGSILEAIRESVARSGPVDAVLGCLRYFYSPFEVEGLSDYYTVLSMDSLRRDFERYRHRTLPSTTLGTAGTAAACAEAGARYFLPYAHGLTGYRQPIGESPFGPGEGLDEARACGLMTDELRRIGCRTEVVHWKPGDSWSPARGASR
jgi:L-ascorbate metabolism protein UlaG (beta-lactamase superfamily)